MRRGGTNSLGYTIVETMIFLAVSGVMFVVAAAFVQGKQTHAEFRQGINDLNSQVQQVINDVSNGYYPSQTTFTCKSQAIGGIPPTISAAAAGDATGQGTRGGVNTDGSGGCVFLGKVIQLGAGDSSGQHYYVYSVAGRQYKTSPADAIIPSSFAEAQPKVIYDSGAGIDQTDKNTFNGGMQVTKLICVTGCTSANQSIEGVGFFSSFSSYGSPSIGGAGSNSQLQTGSQNVLVVPFAGNGSTPPSETEDHMVTDINSLLDASTSDDSKVVAQPNIVACFSDGNEYATLNIGNSSGQRLLSNIQIYQSRPSGC